MSALIFLLSMIVMLLVQCLELFKLYQNIKSINNSNYLLAIGIAWFAVFYIFLSALDAHSEGFVKLYSMPAYFYMITFLVLIVVWILLDMQADIWDDETAKHKAELEECDKKLLQLKINSLEAQYKEMLKSRKVVHDMKNHLLALKKYSQEQDWIGLNDYLNELSEDMLDYNYQIWTGNRMLDMILNEKLKEAKDKKIDMQISTEVFTTLPFTDREIISLFGNLLDNAIEACERITDKNTWIHIKMKKKNQLLYFEIKNTTEHTVQPVPGKFISTKTNGTLHGYGMKNIMDVVEKYRGIFQSQMVEDYFVVMISVYADIYSK
ncbi:ATP-binding protein [Dorea amylophila]|uniref:sensor histidine kinase n=1 Tax=Dorea amylophila TaxID=2981789 RepID=UPI0022E4633E|nr:ATP-binding protein [Dorea amylophila]